MVFKECIYTGQNEDKEGEMDHTKFRKLETSGGTCHKDGYIQWASVRIDPFSKSGLTGVCFLFHTR